MQTHSQQQTQQAQTSQPQATSLPSEGMGGRVVLEGGGTLSPKAYGTDTSDPLDLSVPAEEEEKPADEVNPEQGKQEEVKTGEDEGKDTHEEVPKETEESATPEEVKALEDFTTNLDKALETKTGVGLDGFVEAVTTLLSWYNDILQLEQQQQQRTPNVPAFQRSTARATSPATNSYDFRRSDILAMSPQDYDKNADAITRAYMSGRVLNDA